MPKDRKLSGNIKPLGDVKTMKRNGMRVTIRELRDKANDLELECKDINQAFEVPIINPDGMSDGWIFEESAS
jgi:hypothetical protein